MGKKAGLNGIVGSRIRELRRQREWSQKALAKKIGTPPHSISNYETGKAIPSTRLLVKMADVFGVTVDHLVGGRIPEKAESMMRDRKLLELFKKVEEMNESDKDMVARFLESLVLKNQVEKMSS